MAIRSAEANSGSAAGHRRGRLAALGAGVVVMVLAITGLVIAVNDALRPPAPPDLAAAMRSPVVLDHHKAAAAFLARLSGQTQQADSWLVPQGQAIADDCRVTSASGGAFMAKAPLGVQCERRVTGYYAFDGPLASRLAQLKAELTRNGAGGFAACDRAREPSLGAVTERAVCGSFSVPATLAGPVAFPGVPISVGYTWLGRTDPLDARALGVGVIPPSATTPGWERYYVRREVPARGAVQRGLRAHQHVLILYYYCGYYYNPRP